LLSFKGNSKLKHHGTFVARGRGERGVVGAKRKKICIKEEKE
jgi:hypothetical protein